MLEKFKSNIRKSQGKLGIMDLKKLTSKYKKEYAVMVKEEDEKILDVLAQTQKHILWKGDRMMSMRVKLEQPGKQWDNAVTRIGMKANRGLKEVTKYKKLRVFQGLEEDFTKQQSKLPSAQKTGKSFKRIRN